MCHIHIGQAGTQLGNSAWELYAILACHEIPMGKVSPEITDPMLPSTAISSSTA